MADPGARASEGPDLYPLVDYHSVQAGAEAARADEHPPDGNGNGQDHDGRGGDYVVIDNAAGEVQDHYLNTEDLVAAGVLGPEHAPSPPPPRAARRKRHRARSTVLGSFAVVVVLVVVGLFYVSRQVSPGGRLGTKVAVVIPPHSSTSKIGSILAKAGVIHDGSLFAIYSKVQGAGALLSGTYHLARNESYGAVITVLEAGPPQVVSRLTIPEGYTLTDIAERLQSLRGMHLSAAKFLAASSSGTVRSPYEPPGVNNLEGLVFPATYDVTSSMTEVDVLQKMVQAFDDEASQLGLTQGAAALHTSPYDVVKVASIVEREAKLDGDRGPVASSIYNRLANGMTLGADSTLVYELRTTYPNLNASSINYNQPNAYNTRLNKGLPPTPIANPGIPSLRAATSPPHTGYLYFVETNPDGQLSFATTNAGFQQLENQCKVAHLC